MAIFEAIPGESDQKFRPIVVSARDVWKEFRLYHEKNQSIKEVFLRRKRTAYETFWALKGVSFDVKQGITYGLIGENGSGKSTMLKILAKILRPQQGAVKIDGKVSALLELGTGFHPELTGRENVFLNGSILGLSRKEIENRFDDIVAFSELDQFIDTPVKNYSSGMYVRLGFAVSTNVDPDILLIDEILAVGDEAFQRKSLDKLYELKNQKKTIIIVSHALSSVADICDEAIWLDKGEVKAMGDARKVVEKYLNEVNRQEEERAELVKPEQETGPGSRWGTGEILLNSVKLLDAQGREKTIFQTGEKLTIRMEYEAKESIEKPVFFMAIFTKAGIHCIGTSSRIFGLVPKTLSGRGVVEYSVDKLPLLGGEYLLSVAARDYAGMRNFDFHVQKYPFRISAVENIDTGLFKADSRWEIVEG